MRAKAPTASVITFLKPFIILSFIVKVHLINSLLLGTLLTTSVAALRVASQITSMLSNVSPQ